MAIPKYTGTGLAIGGTALSIFGQIQANLAQARAEEQSARWLRQQGEHFAEATERELEIAKSEGLFQIGEQTGALVAGGVELEGSALDLLDSSYAALDRELAAIEAQGRFAVNEALLKANSADYRAGELSSFRNNFLQAIGAGASGGGQALTAYRKEKKG